MGELWKRLNLKQKKLFSWLLVIAIIAVATLVLQPAFERDIIPSYPAADAQRPQQPINHTDSEELRAILNNYLGGKKSQVFITRDRGAKISIAYNVTEEERQTNEGSIERRKTSTPVILRNDGERKETPLVLEEREPTIRGVLVVLEHKEEAELRFQVAQAVATVLQVPMYRIEVLFKQ